MPRSFDLVKSKERDAQFSCPAHNFLCAGRNLVKGGENKKWLPEKNQQKNEQRKKELLKKQRKKEQLKKELLRKKQQRKELLRKKLKKEQLKKDKDKVFLANKKSSLQMS